MKKTILLVVCALLGVLTASAQKLVLKVNGVEQEPIEVWRIDEMKFIPSEPVNLTDTPDTLDFGLSVRWADRNLGAASPKDPGRLIGWGDTTLTNYSKKLQYFPIENGLNGAYLDDIYGTQYDVAAKKWDDKWHMPSQEEIQELIDACNWTWVNDEENDSVGFVGTLKTDETKTIFLPATGYREGEAINEELKANGYYWSGSLGETNNAWGMSFVSTNDKPSLSKYLRYLGLAIRPVTGKMKVPTQIGTVVATSVEALTAVVTATLTGDLDDVKQIVVYYGTSADALTYSKEASQNAGTVIINLTGLTQNTPYFVKISVTTDKGTLNSEVLSFTTDELPLFPKPDAPVDLGLPSGVKWSPWNMGSSSPMDVPNTDYARYGWGDPTGEVHTQYVVDYAVSTDSKYSSGNVLDIAGTQYDIARVKWGPGWRLPRQKDLNELITKSTVTWGTYTDGNGKTYKGYKITGPNGNSIYLPAAGFKNSDGTLKYDNEAVTYWMSTNKNGVTISIPTLYTSYVDFKSTNGYIYCQLPIRPVYDGSTTPTDPTPTDPTPSDPTPTDPTPSDPTPSDPTPSAGTAVDLGLSVLWADRNVGSSSATAVGSYIRWGETSVPNPEDYSVSTYSLYRNDAYVTEGLLPLPAANDAASAQWGGTWRMPTLSEWDELMNNCDWVQEGDGYRIYKKGSTKKSESIFLPVSGYQLNDKGAITTMNGTHCFYWTSTLSTTVQFAGARAYSFVGKPGGTTKSVTPYERYEGMPIRPVKNK